MRGIYLNTNTDAMKASIDFFAEYNHQLRENVHGNEIVIVYSKYDWTSAPVVQLGQNDGGGRVYCCGWFLYKNERNNLTQLAQDYIREGIEVFDKIDLGAFVFVHVDENNVSVISDCFSLLPHFFSRKDGQLAISPSPKAFNDLPPANPLLVEAHKAKRHLFGNYTVYEGIERLNPGTETKSTGEVTSYVSYDFDHPEKEQFDKVPDYIAKLISHWPEASRTLAISGGLDSRLFLVGQRFENGYTYGPKDSGDRPIARQFTDRFNQYEDFEFTAPGMLEQEKSLTEEMFFGSSSGVPQLLSNYKYTFDKSNGAYVFFDGFMGGTFQRGNPVKLRSLLGIVLKTFPWLYKLNFSAKFLLRRMYQAYSDEVFETLLADFEKRTAHLKANTYQKICWYESLFGYYGRFVINGGNIISGQMYTTVAPFLYKPVYKIMMWQNYTNAVQYKVLKKLWGNTPERYRNMASEAGILPMYPYWLTPFRNMTVRFISHYIPGYGTYAVGGGKGKKY
jgi:hypothetical protein